MWKDPVPKKENKRERENEGRKEREKKKVQELILVHRKKILEQM
jgi:hypothetical protein